jgi:hypothetical protein
MSVSTRDKVYIFAASKEALGTAIEGFFNALCIGGPNNPRQYFTVTTDHCEAQHGCNGFSRAVLSTCFNANMSMHLIRVVDQFVAYFGAS